MLERIECPQCSAPNLTTEVVCFACGRGLRPPPKRLRPPDAEVPWPLWAGVLVALAAGGLLAIQAAGWIAGYRVRAALPLWYLPVAGVLLAGAGQLALWEARRSDRRWWRLKRAPRLHLRQARLGDTGWLRGPLQCETPLAAPYVGQPCAHYRMVFQERDRGQAGWKVTGRESRTVDFRVADERDSIYVPAGGVLLDPPLYVDRLLDIGGTARVRLWALPVGVPVSVCGQVAGDPRRRRLDALCQGLPAVATWRLPEDYVALVARRARLARKAGWALSLLAGLLVIAALAGT